MFEIKSSKGYWMDSKGNMWRKGTYSKEDALKLSRTLKDCRGCIDCSYCNDCKQCEDCHYCYQCEGSTICKFCEGCDQCSRCYYCSTCSYCHYCTRCASCVYCADVKAVSDCKECDDITNAISGLDRYRWALDHVVIDTGAGKVTILVDDYHNLWYQLEDNSQTDWECFAVALKLRGDRESRKSDAVKADLEYIKSIGEFFHKSVTERNKENDKNDSSDTASSSDC